MEDLERSRDLERVTVPNSLEICLEFHVSEVFSALWKSQHRSNKTEFLVKRLINFEKNLPNFLESLSSLIIA